MRPGEPATLVADYERLVSGSYPGFLAKLGLPPLAGRASGAEIEDREGRRFIDCSAGYGAANVGHNHPRVVAALSAELAAGELVTRPLIGAAAVEVAARLEAVTPGDLQCSFLCNSGSEAVDTALKLARASTRRAGIVAARSSWHGYTMGALSVSGIPMFRRAFEPLLPGVRHVDYGDVEALEAAIDDTVGAVILEPIQHEAGIVVPSDAYLRAVSGVCAERGVLLIVDEIKTGLGRTGGLFACADAGVTPDLLVLGKSLGGGLLPAGAVVAPRRLWRTFELSFPMSASSMAGNPLACRAALATFDAIDAEGLLDAARARASELAAGLTELAGRFATQCRDAPGRGLLRGLAMRGPRRAAALCAGLAERGVIALPAFANTSFVMIEPPLVISAAQVGRVLEAIEDALRSAGATPAGGR